MCDINRELISRKAKEFDLGPLFEEIVFFYMSILKKAMPKYSNEQLNILLKTISLDELRLLYKRLPVSVRKELPGNEELFELPYKTQQSVLLLIHNVSLD